MNQKLTQDVQTLLNRYRELYNEWQNSIKEEFGEPINLSDECLLALAVDEAIVQMQFRLKK